MCTDKLPAKLIGNLAITNLPLAILVDFKHADLRRKRIIR